MNKEKLLKPPRVFTLKDPRLQKIRRELRTLIRRAVYDEYDRLSHFIDLYRFKRFPPDRPMSDPPNYMPPCQLKRMQHLGFKRNSLHQALEYSLCSCVGDCVRVYWISGTTRYGLYYYEGKCEAIKQFYPVEKWDSEVPPHYHKLKDSFMSVFRMNLQYCLAHDIPFISWRERKKHYEQKEFGKSTI